MNIHRIMSGNDVMRVSELVHNQERWFVSGHIFAYLINTFPKDALTIFVSRDPVERFFSQYFYWRSFEPNFTVNELSRRAVELAKTESFNTFLTRINTDDFANASPIGEMVRMLGRVGFDDFSVDLALAEERLQNFDVVITTDNLSSKLKDLLSALGLPHVGDTPILNRTETYSISPDMVNLVKFFLKDDYVLHSKAVELERRRTPKLSFTMLSHCISTEQPTHISVDGPIYATGILPVERKSDNRGNFAWRRIEKDPFVLSIYSNNVFSGHLRITVLNSIFNKEYDKIYATLNGSLLDTVYNDSDIIISIPRIEPGYPSRFELRISQGLDGSLRTIGFESIDFFPSVPRGV
jgi:hypothetical protein